MKDSKFTELKLKASVVPEQVRWPEPNVEVSLKGDVPTAAGIHWARLHDAVNEARERVARAWAALDAIDKNGDLSPKGKARQKKEAAVKAIAEFEQSRTLAEAKDAVARQVKKWAEQTGLTVKMPANITESVIQSEIRAHLAAMKGSRFGFLEKHATDPAVASAVLGAPGFLSGLNENELAFVKKRIEKHVAPEIAEARDATLKAMQEAEQGWRKAVAKIGERAGLTKGPDGMWRDPTASEAT